MVIQHLLQLEDESEEHVEANNNNDEINQVIDAGNQEYVVIADSVTLTRRLPPWLAPRGLNHTVPVGRLEELGIRGGITSFSIHREIFHQISAIPRQGVAPSYAQLYFLDPYEANGERRQNQTGNERRAVLSPQYKLILQEGTDRRRYNIQVAREFAIVIPDEVESDGRDVILIARNSDGILSQNFQYIHCGHPAYLPLHYVLFFPSGNPGYRWNLRVTNANQRVLGNIEHDHEEQQDGTANEKKIGLPHVHILLYLHEDDVPKTPEQVDELVRAQIPTDDPKLAEIVKKQLTHGHCGPGFPNAPCYRDGKSAKGYPKPFCETTILADNSYPVYSRTKNGITWCGAHINVEVAKGVHAIKYLAKYVYKGSDRASIAADNRHDEIKMTLQGRYISPAKAIWRLMAYATHEEKPAVLLLHYHLEGDHRVSFPRRLGPQQLAAAIGTQSSIFLDWMRSTIFPGFVYRKWYIYDVPSAACRALGLTFDDSEWYSLFNEIKDLSMESSLRLTFAAGLAHCVINDPQNIWDHFREAFIDDCLFRLRNLEGRLNPPPLEWNEEQCRYDYGLWLFGENLRHLDIDLRVARLRGPMHNWTTLEDNPLMTEALNFDREAEGTNYRDFLTKLSPDQRAAYESIVETIDNGNRPNTFFIQGRLVSGNFFSTIQSAANIDRKGKLFLTLQLKQNFGAVDRTFQSLLNNRDFFDGIPVVLGGDFAQILPVVKRGGKDEIINVCIRYWSKWNLIRILFLTDNMRVVMGEENQRFASWLSELPYTPSLY
ncbi:hypothetical protein EPUL_003749, partial [Erysiphe pulchra]